MLHFCVYSTSNFMLLSKSLHHSNERVELIQMLLLEQGTSKQRSVMYTLLAYNVEYLIYKLGSTMTTLVSLSFFILCLLSSLSPSFIYQLKLNPGLDLNWNLDQNLTLFCQTSVILPLFFCFCRQEMNQQSFTKEHILSQKDECAVSVSVNVCVMCALRSDAYHGIQICHGCHLSLSTSLSLTLPFADPAVSQNPPCFILFHTLLLSCLL